MRSVRATVRASVLACVAATMVCAAAFAQVTQDQLTVRQTLDAIKGGDMARVAELLESLDVGAVSETLSVDLLDGLMLAAPLEPPEPKAWQPVVDFATACAARLEPDDLHDAEERALFAAASVLRARTAAAAGADVDPAEWMRAADAYWKSATEAASAADAAAAICVLEEAGAWGGAARKAFLDRAAEMTKEAQAEHAESYEFEMRLARGALATSVAMVGPKRKEAKRALSKVVDSLPRLVEATADPEKKRAAQGLMNRAVSFDRVQRFVLKSDYMTRTSGLEARKLTCDVPIDSDVTSMAMEGQPSGDLNQYTPDGVVLRTLSTESYAWRIMYVFADQEVGGDNVKKLAKARLAQVKRELFRRTKGKSSVKKGKVLSGISGSYFVVEGTGTDGLPLRVRAWFFRGKSQRTFEIILRGYDDPKELGPVLEALLSSIREAGQ